METKDMKTIGAGGLPTIGAQVSSGTGATSGGVQMALNNCYTKAETYSKEEVNALVTTPDVEYATYIATDETSVDDILPAEGASDTVYRVGSWDGEQVDETKYALYAWNGSSYTLLAVRSEVGEVFDISEYNASGGTLATYADLAAALGASGANVPEGVRKGGMSVKYVQSSDNKYVQYRLKTTYFSTYIEDWEEVNNLEVCSSGSEFFIGDKLGYAILAVLNGYIKTKNFDSESVSLAISTIQEEIERLSELSEEIKLVPGIMGDLSFIDINDFIIAAFKEGHIKTKNFDSSSIEYSNLSDNLKAQINPLEKQDIIKIPLRKSIKILFIGNSISQDHATYIPWLLSTLYNGNTEDLIDYTVGIFYIGSHRIDQYAVEDWDTLKAQIWSIANNTPIWTNTQNVTSLNDALAAADWDIISIQGYFNTGVTDDVTKAVQFVSKLRQQVQNNFKLAYLIHQTYRGDSMFKTILEAAATVIQQNDVSVLFAPGLANEYAKPYFTNVQLSSDSTHNNEGLPCMIGAYECLSALLQELKTENVILGDTNILTLAIWQTLNIPGPNGTMDETLNTQEDYEHIQECALLAFDKANMLLENLKTLNIYDYVKVNIN